MNGDSLVEPQTAAMESAPGVETLFKVVENWPIGLVWLDRGGRVVAINQTLCSVLGTIRSALVGRTQAELWRGLKPESDNPDQPSLDLRVVGPDGAVRWLYGRATALHGADGSASGTVWALIDLTERIVAEQALRESERYKTEFLAVLSHELRNPLAPLRNALALLQRETLSSRGGQALAIAQRQLGQCIRIVEDLLDTSRLSQGKVALRIERVLLSRVLHTVLENTQALRAERAQALQLIGVDQSIWLNADPARLQQIFENVLINASKYTDRQGCITVRVSVDQERVTVAISDTGVGIAPEYLPQVFELFKQVDTHASRCAGGLGIGLALVKQLVELHGGQVAMHSAGLGQGATVTIGLPHRARGMGQRQAWHQPD
jgi:PAS domain S-box-containing protein